MDSQQPDILEQTLAGLELGLHVRHIATYNPTTCDVNESAATVLGRPENAAFDAIPVKDGSRTVGLLERDSGNLAGTARNNMTPLDDSMLVSADEPLADFIKVVADKRARLVVTGASIDAIVTRSDLQKLPVRLFAFALITHLESTMAELIQLYCPKSDRWLNMLKDDRRQGVLDKLKDYGQNHLDPLPIEFTEFCDKRDLTREMCGFGQAFLRDMKRIEKLRNTVAHAGSYAENDAELKKFVDTINACEFWTGKLKQEIANRKRPA